jgi:hypothetical protein
MNETEWRRLFLEKDEWDKGQLAAFERGLRNGGLPA